MEPNLKIDLEADGLTKKDELKPRGSRPLVEDVPEFSVLKCTRSGSLRNGSQSTVTWHFLNGQIGQGKIHSHGESITLDYQMRSGDEAWHSEKIDIELDFTPVHLGGERTWFLCPSCGRRCLSLYWLSQFECRRCHDLVYRTARVDSLQRLEVRLSKVRSKVEGRVVAGAFIPRRPKGMHHRTYAKLDTEQREIERQMWRTAVARFGGPRA